MKQRLLVMNGQCIVQSEEDGKWKNEKVEKAGNIRPGIYNLYLSTQADKGKSYDGAILYADKEAVYQQIEKKYVRHDKEDFDKVPEIGSSRTIKYDQGRALVSALSEKLIKSRSR